MNVLAKSTHTVQETITVHNQTVWLGAGLLCQRKDVCKTCHEYTFYIYTCINEALKMMLWVLLYTPPDIVGLLDKAQ